MLLIFSALFSVAPHPVYAANERHRPLLGQGQPPHARSHERRRRAGLAQEPAVLKAFFYRDIRQGRLHAALWLGRMYRRSLGRAGFAADDAFSLDFAYALLRDHSVREANMILLRLQNSPLVNVAIASRELLASTALIARAPGARVGTVRVRPIALAHGPKSTISPLIFKARFYRERRAGRLHAALDAGLAYDERMPADDAFALDLAYALMQAHRYGEAATLLLELRNSPAANIAIDSRDLLTGIAVATPQHQPPTGRRRHARRRRARHSDPFRAPQAYYRRAIAARPRDAAAIRSLFYVDRRAGNDAEALRMASLYVALQPTNDRFVLDYGYALLDARHYRRAAAVLARLQASPAADIVMSSRVLLASLSLARLHEPHIPARPVRARRSNARIAARQPRYGAIAWWWSLLALALLAAIAAVARFAMRRRSRLPQASPDARAAGAASSAPPGATESEEDRRLGTTLLRRGKISEPELIDALNERRASDELLGEVLVRRGSARERDVLQAVADTTGIPSALNDDLIADPSLVAATPMELAYQCTCVPLRADDGTVVVAGPRLLSAKEEAEFRKALGRRPSLHLAEHDRVLHALARAYLATDERRKPLGRYLVDCGCLDEQELLPLVDEAATAGRRLLEHLVRTDRLSTGQTRAVVKEYFESEVEQLPKPGPLPSTLLERLPFALMQRHEVAVIGRNGTLTIAAAYPLAPEVVTAFANVIGGDLQAIVATRPSILKHRLRYFNQVKSRPMETLVQDGSA